MSFPQIERLLQLDELIRSSQRHTQASLAQALEVSDRTIRTYIDFMRDRLNAPQKDEAEPLFELLVMLAILTHDLGKLQVKWQQVMRGWQQIAHDKFKEHPDFKVRNPQSHLLAHTDHKPSVKSIKAEYNEFMSKHQRPPHAIKCISS